MEKNRPNPPPPMNLSETPEEHTSSVQNTEKGDFGRPGKVVTAAKTTSRNLQEEPIESAGGEWGFLPWIMIGSTGFILFGVILKQILLRIVPLLFLMLVFFGVLYFLYRKYMYRDIEEVEEEYAPLISLLRAEKMNTYLRIIGTAWKNLKSARDRAERVREGLRRGDISGLEARLKVTRAQAMIETEPTVKSGLDKNIREQEENLRSLIALRDFLKKFEMGKKHLAESCRNLRLKIEMKQLAREVGGATSTDEIDGIVSEIEKLDFIFDKVDG
ncbi:MAG: hypothetical protein HQM09_23045 [Candidatus Riflebacteria bacterium]|nr:hypothetical protein [Candidatus Riflebacteria bacterium]